MQQVCGGGSQALLQSDISLMRTKSGRYWKSSQDLNLNLTSCCCWPMRSPVIKCLSICKFPDNAEDDGFKLTRWILTIMDRFDWSPSAAQSVHSNRRRDEEDKPASLIIIILFGVWSFLQRAASEYGNSWFQNLRIAQNRLEYLPILVN